MEKERFSVRRNLILRNSRIHGRGVFARTRIRRGTRLLEYTGERISAEEANERYGDDDESTPHHTFLFAVDDHVVIDGAFGGSMARYINHSCNPNCEAVVEDGRVFIEAIRTIAPGDELCYDYNFILEEPHTAKTKKRYPCICGSRKCRGTILGRKR